MSHKPYYKEVSKSKSLPTHDDDPVINRFSDVQKIDKRRHEVLDFMVIGYDPEEIAEYLGEPLKTIEADVEAIMKIGYQARDEELTEVRDEIMRIYRLAGKEAYAAFKKSQGTIETVTEEQGENSKGPYRKKKVKTEEQAGDPRMLNVMIDSAKEMGKVTGAQKHKEVEMANTVNNNTMNILSPERTKMPSDFDRWTKKPDDAEIPDGQEVNMEDI